MFDKRKKSAGGFRDFSTRGKPMGRKKGRFDKKRDIKDVPERKPPEKEKELPPVPVNLFNKWDSNAEIKDPGLKKYINVYPRLLPRSAGTKRERCGYGNRSSK